MCMVFKLFTYHRLGAAFSEGKAESDRVDGSSFGFTLHALVGGDPDGVQIQWDHCGILVNNDVEAVFVARFG